jgi:hypothetical protein
MPRFSAGAVAIHAPVFKSFQIHKPDVTLIFKHWKRTVVCCGKLQKATIRRDTWLREAKTSLRGGKNDLSFPPAVVLVMEGDSHQVILDLGDIVAGNFSPVVLLEICFLSEVVESIMRGGEKRGMQGVAESLLCPLLRPKKANP